MINSRDIADLHPRVQPMAREFVAHCAAAGIDLLVTSTFRDADSQAALYAQGRTKPGNVVTNAKPGLSWHNWRCALDVVPLRIGKPVWGTASKEDATLWAVVGEIGEACGLEWAGRWTTFRELAHFQFRAGLTLCDFAAGKTLDDA